MPTVVEQRSIGPKKQAKAFTKGTIMTQVRLLTKYKPTSFDNLDIDVAVWLRSVIVNHMLLGSVSLHCGQNVFL